MPEKKQIYIVLGPTASGKESASFSIAPQINAEIISIDSMKIYTGLDIGTAKASQKMQAQVPHHCLDIAQPTENFSVSDFVECADNAITDIIERGKVPLLSGGTALYYKGLIEGIFEAPAKDEAYRLELEDFARNNGNEELFKKLLSVDPLSAEKLHPNDLRRVIRALEVVKLTGKPISASQKQWSGFHSQQGSFSGELRYDFKMVMLDWPRDLLYERVEKRVDIMIEQGLEDEAKTVYENRDTYSRTPLQAVGYKEFFPYFAGDESLEEAISILKMNTRRLAKSQCTWFRKFPAEVIAMHPKMTATDLATRILSIFNL